MQDKIIRSIPLTKENIEKADCIVILQKHQDFDCLEELFIDGKAIVDLVNAYPKTHFYYPESNGKVYSL